LEINHHHVHENYDDIDLYDVAEVHEEKPKKKKAFGVGGKVTNK
jgi:hypothetical protein